MKVQEQTLGFWGAHGVNIKEKSLPALKANFLLHRLPHRGRVAEIGCGDGKILHTIAAAKPELELFGFDVQRPRSRSEKFEFQLIESSKLPAEDASFDVVLIFDVLEHVESPETLLDEARRILRPNGKLLAFVPIEGEPLSVYRLYRDLLGSDTFAQTKGHIQAFTHSALRVALERRFAIGEVKYCYHFLGQFFDASFFAAARLRSVSEFWWKGNRYYNPDKTNSNAGYAVINGLMATANAAAWWESTLFANCETGSCGVLIEATCRD